MEQMDVKELDVLDFLDIIYGDLEGIVYLATKDPSTGRFGQAFYNWPTQRNDVRRYITDHRELEEVYFAPALRDKSSGDKQSVSNSRVLWCEFDGKIPEDYGILPSPSIRVRSSEEGREHWYWVLDNPIDRESLDKVNRSITYYYGADSSGWDASQILRPIDTVNHKRNKNVELLAVTEGLLSLDAFDGLPTPPPLQKPPEIGNLPDLGGVLARYTFNQDLQALFESGIEVGDRSKGLMMLGYDLAELGMTNEEMFVTLMDADERWGKFSERPDRNIRISEIITIAKEKYPNVTIDYDKFARFGFLDVINSDIKLEWVVEGLIHKKGYMLITGPSGVGKTQFILSLIQHVCLNRKFLDFNIPDKRFKVGFFSLEMGIEELQHFVRIQSKQWNSAEQQTLQERLGFYPLGEPLYLNRKEEREFIENMIVKEELDGIVIDSLGSMTEESLSGEADIKTLLDWTDRIRQTLGIFTIYIHHHRKATSDNKKPNKLADVYGNQYIPARSTSTIGMWPIGEDGTKVHLNALKVRLYKKFEPKTLYRTSRLHFSIHKNQETAIIESVLTKPSDEIETEGGRFRL